MCICYHVNVNIYNINIYYEISSTVRTILLCHLPLEYAQNTIITINNISDSPGMLFYYMPSHV